MKKFFLAILVCGFIQTSQAQLLKVTAVGIPQTPVQSTNLLMSVNSTSTPKYSNYKLPKVGRMTKIAEANFEMFPEQIEVANYFSASSTASTTLLAISRKWQTACLYNASGTIATYSLTTKQSIEMCFQVGTGKNATSTLNGVPTDLRTPLGLYNIQDKKDKDYASQLYTSTGKELKPEDFKKEELRNKTKVERNKILGLAPMPYAMHIGKVVWLENNNILDFLYSDGTALHEKQTANHLGSYPFVSHGCIALPKNYGKYLQGSINIGDMVMIFEEDMPKNLHESMMTGIMSHVNN